MKVKIEREIKLVCMFRLLKLKEFLWNQFDDQYMFGWVGLFLCQAL